MEFVTKTGVMARNDRIPLPKYRQMHPEARLRNDDARLFAWTRGERSRLQDDEIQGAGVQRGGPVKGRAGRIRGFARLGWVPPLVCRNTPGGTT